MTTFRQNRRRFLGRSLGIATAATSTPLWFESGIQAETKSGSKDDRPLVGSIGLGGQGSNIAKRASEFGEVVAVCDVDRDRADVARETFGEKPEVYEDYRKLLDREDIEAVTIGTPDHWHTAIALAAMDAGKDVYCEKPLTLTVEEGITLREAVQDTGRVFQVGTQQRSDGRFRLACEMVLNGWLGKLQKVTVTLPDSTQSGGPFATKPVPASLNWDMWLGQAPEVGYCPERCHYSFRWWYEYSGGIMTDWGAHHMDIAHWAMGLDDSGPITVHGHAQLPNIENGFNTPKRLTVDCEYPNDVQLQVKLGDNGVLFEGDEGRIFVNRGRLTGAPYEKFLEKYTMEERPSGWKLLAKSTHHMRNFFDCIKSRETPVSDVASHHRSITACHICNISMRLGRKLQWDATKEKFVGDSEADSMLKRAQRSPYMWS